MTADGAIQEEVVDAEVVPDEAAVEEPKEVPSVFSVTNRYLVGAAEVSPPAEDGSRVIRLQSATGGAVVEANLSPELCVFISGKLVEVDVIAEEEEVDGEVVEDARSTE